MDKNKQQVLFDGITPIIDTQIKLETVENKEIVHCRVCNRILKNPASKLVGMGETCAEKFQKGKITNNTIKQMKIL